jgi:hypothetical protein
MSFELHETRQAAAAEARLVPAVDFSLAGFPACRQDKRLPFAPAFA